MQKIILLLVLIVLIVLIGCTTLTIEEKESICKKECLSDGWEYGTFVGVNFCNCFNRTIIDTINITIPCNITNTTCPEYNYNYTSSTSRELELIRRISFLEGQQDKYWNYSECNWELNKSNKELKTCEEEVCNWNSSWC